MLSSMRPIRRALISVSDKDKIVDFSHALIEFGIEILTTGGTASLLRVNGVHVKEISQHTGFPEIMEGRLKTLHPKIHGGILGSRKYDMKTMKKYDILPIDLVVVNLYPFLDTIEQSHCTLKLAIDNIDIGGLAMLRASAKNYRDVTVVTDKNDYQIVLKEMRAMQGRVSKKMRFHLALKVFEHTSSYDNAIFNFLKQKNKESINPFPQTINLQFKKKHIIRYGENPHQNAAFYTIRTVNNQEANVANAEKIQGKILSYNNITDTDTALECIKEFDKNHPSCVIVKHSNPCGVAIRTHQIDAYDAAYCSDPESAFGGIIAFNTILEGETTEAIIDRQFVEVIIAPDISTEAQSVIKKKTNIRLLRCGNWRSQSQLQWFDYEKFDYKHVNGGLLIQERDLLLVKGLKIVTHRRPSEQEWSDLKFAWKVAKYVKSNAIIYAYNGQTIGVGAGQMSRINSVRLAEMKAEQAGFQLSGSVMASDAFFPFRDGLDKAAARGITAVIQPGGSIKDKDIIASADEHDMVMIFTGMRHFRH